VDQGHSLDETNAFDANLGTREKEIMRTKLNGFVVDFLGRLIRRDGQNTTLGVFCRVDVSIFVDNDKRVAFFVNEVERGMTTCLFGLPGPAVVGRVGSDLAWPLACWIIAEKARLHID
jgi:hypothetical protein